jgi:hypothetical protein
VRVILTASYAHHFQCELPTLARTFQTGRPVDCGTSTSADELVYVVVVDAVGSGDCLHASRGTAGIKKVVRTKSRIVHVWHLTFLGDSFSLG